MSHFTSKRKAFRNSMCGQRFADMGERNRHEVECQKCEAAQASLVAQSRPVAKV